MVRDGEGLSPRDEEAAELLRRFRQGSELTVDVTAPRNPRRHRLLFALMSIVVANSDRFVDVEAALLELKVRTGRVKMMIAQNGRVILIPESIAWSRMDEPEFAAFFDAALKVVCTEWLTGTGIDDLRREVFEIVDRPWRGSSRG